MLKIIQVGHDDASDRYIRNKVKAVEEAGMQAEVINLPYESPTFEVVNVVRLMNDLPSTSAIIVQLPLPNHIAKKAVLSSIDPKFDIDGLNPKSDYKPLTPCAIMRWLDEQGVELPGKDVVIFGRSELVGKPLANMMIDAGATVTVFNSKSSTQVVWNVCEKADIIVSAVGKPNTIRMAHIPISPVGVIVIDVGINRDDNGKLCGDVSLDVKSFLERNLGICTPVPGGVGKWTVRELVLRLAEMEEKKNDRRIDEAD